MRSIYLLCLSMVVASIWSAAQTKAVVRVSGYVSAAATGVPLQGASLQLVRSNTRAVSDQSGFFALSQTVAPDTLLISFTGYISTSIVVTAKTKLPLQIVLQEDYKGLSDVTVVSTGYQAIPKERATGSFEVVNKELINRSTSPNILERLNGLTTGLLFDRRGMSPDQTGISVNDLTVRGLSTLTAAIKSPLIVIDNFPYEGDINNINPNDIESITLLKDAAAASIWGAKAGNGVIVMSTKKGGSTQKPVITANMNSTISEKPDLFKYPRMSSADFINLEQFLYGKGFYNSALNVRNGAALSPVVELLHKETRGLVTQDEVASTLAQWSMQDVRNDYDRYVYQEAITTQYSLSISGGTSAVRYYLSGGYDKGRASLVNNGSDRITVRAQNSIAVTRQLELSSSLQLGLIQSKNNNGFGFGQYAYGTGKKLYPYARLADDNGNALTLPKDYRQDYVDTIGGGTLLDWHYKPLDEIANGNNSSKQQDIVLNVAARYRVNNIFSTEIRYQYERSNVARDNINSIDMYSTRSMINLFTQKDPGKLRYVVPRGAIKEAYYYGLASHGGRAQVNAAHSWRNNHQVNAIAGFELRQLTTSSDNHTIYGFNPDNLTTAPVDFSNAYPFYDGLGSGRISSGIVLEQTNNRFVSLYANGAYTYKGRYILSASARRDATNLFGATTNNKWKPLWSGGFSWELSKEHFYTVNWLPYLRLRLTYGHSGNTNNGFSARPIISISSNNNAVISQPSGSISQPGNENLSWESVGMFNAGIDFGWKNNWLRGSLEYYEKRPKDVISGVTADPTTGILGYSANSVNMLNRGVDINLTSLNTTGFLKWETNYLFSYTDSKITRFLFDRSKDLGSGFTGDGVLIKAVADKNPYGIFSYAWEGLDANGNPQGIVDGKPSTDYNNIFRTYIKDMVYNGPATPTYFGSIRNNLSMGNFHLSFNVLFRFGYYFRKTALRYDMLYNQNITHADYAKRWQQPGDENKTTVPSMVYPLVSSRDAFYQAASVNVLRGDNIRLQDINLGYDVQIKGKNGVPGPVLQFYLYANNLWIIWRANREGLDPDYNAGNPLFPALKTISGGVRINL